MSTAQETVNHPAHYQAPNDTDGVYEAIRVIEAWGLGFCLGNTLKYIARAGKKGPALDDLRKARWYLDREIQKAEPPVPAEPVEVAPVTRSCETFERLGA